MKVLQLTSNYPTKTNPIFGIFMKEQVDSLERYGVENIIFFSNGSESKYGEFVHLCSVLKLQWHLLWHRYDIIHCHSNVSGLIAAVSGVWMFKKCILSFQNDPEKEHDAKVFRMLYPLFKKVIVKKPTKYLKWENVVYLPNGCNTEFFKPRNRAECKKKLGLKEDVDYLLYVDSNTSKNRSQKRKDRFDETMQILRTKYNHNVEELVMIGVKREMVPIWMNACSLHLMTSDLEGSPNSIKECLMCNVPIVSTDVGNVREMVEGITGAYVSDSFTAEELAEKAHMVLDSKTEFRGREALIAKGYGINKVGERLFKLYKEVINGKKEN